MTRECGDCQVCCELPMVDSLQKPMFTRCEHQCAEGCGIYETRPARCRAFTCAWLRGDAELSDEDRPDRLGLMLETCVSTADGGPEIPFVHAWEARPGAFTDDPSQRALALIEKISAFHPVKVQRYKQSPILTATDPDLAPRVKELQRRLSLGVDLKVGRNEPCPCGSGKKFKKCHGKKG